MKDKITELKLRMDKTASKVGSIKGEPLSKILEEIHEKEDG